MGKAGGARDKRHGPLARINISLKQSRLKERTFLFYNVKRVLSLPSGRIIIDQSGQKSDVMSQTFLSIMTTGS